MQTILLCLLIYNCKHHPNTKALNQKAGIPEKNLITSPNGSLLACSSRRGQVFLVVASTISLCFTPAGQKVMVPLLWACRHRAPSFLNSLFFLLYMLPPVIILPCTKSKHQFYSSYIPKLFDKVRLSLDHSLLSSTYFHAIIHMLDLRDHSLALPCLVSYLVVFL